MLEKFTIIYLIKTRSASVCTFTGNYIKFNVQTCAELRYPEYIQFLFDPKGKQLAIRPCKEDAPNAVKFSKPESKQKFFIRMTQPAITDLVCKTMGWEKPNWNVPGIYFADEQAIIYALDSAYAPKARGGVASKREEAATEDALTKGESEAE
jgi:hypothetical protein